MGCKGDAFSITFVSVCQVKGVRYSIPGNPDFFHWTVDAYPSEKLRLLADLLPLEPTFGLGMI